MQGWDFQEVFAATEGRNHKYVAPALFYFWNKFSDLLISNMVEWSFSSDDQRVVMGIRGACRKPLDMAPNIKVTSGKNSPVLKKSHHSGFRFWLLVSDL